jgi:hypothetical protein
MNYNMPDYFSHKLELKLDKLPAKTSDRTNWRFILPGLIFGALLFFLGTYEFFNGFRQPKSSFDDLIGMPDALQYQPLINPTFFDIVFILIGLGMIAASITSYIRYKKIIFDGKTVTIGFRPVLGEKVIIRENFKNYQGVRFRIEFFQFGFINKNKYIIELYHKDPNRIIPLYISTSEKDIRKIWEHYARTLNLPALVNTDEGLIARDVKNLDKSLKEMAELGYVIDNYDSYEALPDTIAYVRRKDKIVIKARKIVWDAYNIIAWIAILAIGGLVIAAGANFETLQKSFSPSAFFITTGICAFIIITAVFILFRKEKLIIKKDKIVNTHKYMLFSTKHDEIPKTAIEAIDITENPASGRYFVSVISDEKSITFGAKLPIKDLRWVKKFLIHEVIK